MANVIGTSTDSNTPGVNGENLTGVGVRGTSQGGTGVLGTSTSGVGVWGGSQRSSGLGGMSQSGIGVHGVSETGDGVRGTGRRGVVGSSETFQGVFGKSRDNAGVVGESDKLHGVYGVCHNPNGGGVYGTNDAGGFGVQGDSKSGRGVFGYSENGEGMHGETKSPTVAAIAGFNLNPTGTGAAIYGKKEGSAGHAGFFDGNVHVTGDITLANADCAEHFDIADATAVEPGTVMVVGNEGVLHQSCQPYDKRVAGVISGAGDYKPGIVLDKQQSQSNRKPIALLGKVFCKVDAQYGEIEVGDLLTTSSTPGYAMKTTDPQRAFGAVIGKALRPLKEGQGLIPILIALQ